MRLKTPFIVSSANSQVGGGIESFYPAVYHNGYPVAVLRFVHVMGSYEDRDPTVGRAVYQFPELPACGRVYPAGRLVQKDDCRTVEYRHGKGQFLLPSQGQVPHHRVVMLRETERGQRFVGTSGDFSPAEPVYSAEQPDVLPYF